MSESSLETPWGRTVEHFLQTEPWGRAHEANGGKFFRRQGNGWSYQALLESGTLNSRLYVPYGPTFTDAAALREALRDLRQLGEEQSVTFLRVEPTNLTALPVLQMLEFVDVSDRAVQPTLTRAIDLAPDSEDLIRAMRKSTRPLVRNYAKKGVTVRQSQDPADVELLIGLLEKVSHRTPATFHTPDYFRNLAEVLFPLGAASLFVAEVDGNVGAASMAFDSEDTRIYAHAAADDEYRKKHVGTALLGEMILRAKASGLQYFDLYGVTDSPDPEHPWAGFSSFKADFGGELVRYAGMWERPLRPMQYALYRGFKKARGQRG